jgi:hypothetical protein
MSEYQYYEFRAIDRPLTEDEQNAVARLSSRVDPHPWRAVFVYHWSNFPGDSKQVLAQYYDAMLYLTNWGTRRLLFRFPGVLIDLEAAQAYCQPPYVDEFVAFSTHGETVLLDILFRDEERGEWIEGEGWLGTLLPLRDDILRGDYRVLYLAWLKTLEVEDVLDSVIEPPVPPGLSKLTSALRAFVELFDVDTDLIQVAAERSGKIEAASQDDLRQAIAVLAPEEKDAFLLRLAQGETHLSLALKRRLRTLGHLPAAQDAASARRSVGELLAAARSLGERRRKEQAAAAEARRIAELEALARREGEVWRQVEALIQQGKAKEYDQAIHLLLELKALAEYQCQQALFEDRVRAIHDQYSRRTALVRRLRRARLVP